MISDDIELSTGPGASAPPRFLQVPGRQGPCLIFFKVLSSVPRIVPGTWEAINK